MFTLHNGDCLQVLPSIPSGSIDAIITDLPYGTTACAWDEVIPFADMWKEVKRVLKSDGVFVTTTSQPFTSALIMSNPEWFKHEWIWHKSRASNFLHGEIAPLKYHENIAVFSANLKTYNPELRKGESYKRRIVQSRKDGGQYTVTNNDNSVVNTRYPESVLDFPSMRQQDISHPTQKPVALYRYLIRTYTNAGETVLDIAMGSGTTIEAAIIEGRYSIGIEKDTEFGYFQVAEKRAKLAVLSPSFLTPSNNRLHLTGGGLPAIQSSFTAEGIAPAKLPAKSPRR